MKIAVIGGGSWGATLAILLFNQGYEVSLWEFLESEVERYRAGNREIAVLPGVRLPEKMPVSNDLEQVAAGADMILLAVPSHAVRTMSERLAELVKDQPIVVNVAKGIENHTLLRMSQVVAEAFPRLDPGRYVCLSGPSHAEEVSREIPTAVVAGSSNLETARRVQKIFSNHYFRVYTNDDLVGVEVGGAVKNVVAIAAGLCDGLQFGDNTKGALLTRGQAEIGRLGREMGARRETFFGLSGIGDLITTCMSRHSRNRFVGDEIGKGRKLNEVLAGMKMVAEGVKTTRSVHDLIRKHQISMPIAEAVYRILFADHDPRQEVYDLMTRELKGEQEY